MSASSPLSVTFKEHFEDQRSLAAAYLLTVGAKALFYTEKEVEPLKAKESFKEEASIHMSMKLDEISAAFVSKITSEQGMKVKKRGRNGRTRHLVVHMRTNDTELEYIPETKSFYSNSCSLVYKSFWNMTKKFDLDNISMLTLGASSDKICTSSFDTTSTGGIFSGSGSSQRGYMHSLQSVGDCKSPTCDDDKSTSNNSDYGVDSKVASSKKGSTSLKKQGQNKKVISIPYIRITNADRYIDLQFDTLADHQGCLESLQKFCQTKCTRIGRLVIDNSSSQHAM